MTSEDTDASNGGEQFDVSNILADYFKDKIRQGIGGEWAKVVINNCNNFLSFL